MLAYYSIGSINTAAQVKYCTNIYYPFVEHYAFASKYLYEWVFCTFAFKMAAVAQTKLAISWRLSQGCTLPSHICSWDRLCMCVCVCVST